MGGRGPVGIGDVCVACPGDPDGFRCYAGAVALRRTRVSGVLAGASQELRVEVASTVTRPRCRR